MVANFAVRADPFVDTTEATTFGLPTRDLLPLPDMFPTNVSSVTDDLTMAQNSLATRIRTHREAGSENLTEFVESINMTYGEKENFEVGSMMV